MPNHTEIENIDEIRFSQREELQEMLGNPPSWILYSGIAIVFLVTIVGLLLSWIIKYPDKMEASVIIRTEYAPTEIVAQLSGVLDTLCIIDGQEVKEGDVLGIVDNAAKWGDVLKLEEWIGQVRSNQNKLTKLLSHAPAPKENSEQALKTSHLQNSSIYFSQKTQRPILGELQNRYAQICQQIEALQYFLHNPTTREQSSSIAAEIKQIKKLNAALREQETILSDEVDLVKKDYERNRTLYKDGVISELDLEKKEATYLTQKRSHKQMKSTQIQNNIRIENLKAQRLKHKRDFETENASKIINLQQQLNSYIGDIQKWKQRYLIMAPTDGILVFQANIKAELAITAGTILFTILPQKQENNIYAYCEMPVIGAGKVVKGNPVHIYLDEYPYKEYGMIAAKIKKISAIAQKNKVAYNYNVLLELPINQDSLQTTYQRNIPFHQNMTGTANIITEDKSILERIFERLMDLVKN